MDKVVRKVAGRGNQRGRAIETPHCQAGALAREGSWGHYREAKWLSKCQDEYLYIWIFVFEEARESLLLQDDGEAVSDVLIPGQDRRHLNPAVQVVNDAPCPL